MRNATIERVGSKNPPCLANPLLQLGAKYGGYRGFLNLCVRFWQSSAGGNHAERRNQFVKYACAQCEDRMRGFKEPTLPGTWLLGYVRSSCEIT